MGRIIWTPQSQNDLRSIYNYIASDSKRYALREVRAIKNSVGVLSSFQKSGKVFDELDNTSIREIVYKHYRVIYKIVNDNQVDILTVHHGARSIPKRKLKF